MKITTPGSWVDRVRADLGNAPFRDLRIGQIAVLRRYLTAEQLGTCLREQQRLRAGGRSVRLGYLLCHEGLLCPSDFAHLLRDQGRYLWRCRPCDRLYDVADAASDAFFRCLKCEARLERDERPRDDDPSERTPYSAGEDGSGVSRLKIGKYVLRREIARGGMGIVFEAEDPELRRTIALKVIREGDVGAKVVTRLHREAAITARLQHPNIVAVHEVGTVQDSLGRALHFIAMEYVEGGTLANVFSDPRRRRADRLRMMLDLARAVAYAHAQGVVHRDLKPGNVLVDRAGRVRLTDFGLARAEGFGTRLTRTQAFMGTPQYMAPEQVAGMTRKVDGRSDVYGLGVMLYEALFGQLPFRASAFGDLCVQILSEEPSRRPKSGHPVDRDLEIICFKAMEKEPDRRYQGAQEFARDLHRYLNGEPIAARPPSLGYRLGKMITRRKSLLGTALVGATVVTIVAGVLLLRLRVAERQADDLRGSARVQLRKRTGAALKAAVELRRSGNLEAMDWFERETEEACRQAMVDLPGSAEPHYRLGRMYRARMKDDAALARQEEALRQEPDFGPSLYERVVLSAKKHRLRTARLVTEAWRAEARRLEGLPSESRKSVDFASEHVRDDAELAALRASLLRDLERLPSAKPAVSTEEWECAQGLLAWVRGDREGARTLLERVVAGTPALEEAFEALAILDWEAGKFSDSARRCTEGIEHDRGYVPHWEGRSKALWIQGLSEVWEGKDPQPSYRQAVDDLTFVLERMADREWSWWWRGEIRLDWGKYREGTGGNPLDQYTASLEDFSRALNVSPEMGDSWAGRGEVRRKIARILVKGGRDPTAELRGAVEDLSEAVRRSPENAEYRLLRSWMHGDRALWLSMQGEDPSSAYADAIRDLDAAATIAPDSSLVWAGRGSLLGDWGRFRARSGRDPTSQFAEAVAAFENSLRSGRDPLRHAAHLMSASTYADWGMYRMGRSEDPSSQFAAATKHCDEALRLNPALPDSWTARARLRILWGHQGLLERRDPTSHFQAALQDIDESLRRGPRRDLPWILRGTLNASRGLWEGMAGKNPVPLFEMALGDLERAFEISRTNAETWEARGKLHFLRGAHAASQDHYRAALADYEEAVRLDRTLELSLRPQMEECRRRSGD